MPNKLSRRKFLAGTALTAFGTANGLAAEPPSEPIIDIHQHTNYSGRTDAQLIAHQKALGVTTSILLPAGRLYGLDADCGKNETVVALAKKHPDQFVFFANEITNIPEAREEITKYLNLGAIGIGEQKFRVACDSPEFQQVAEVAQEFGVPVLMHFMHERYNTGIDRFHKVLQKFPKVNFIGHAQTWWGNVDKNHEQKAMYPTAKVTPGGITDRLLSEHPNMYGDLSAGSGLNFFTRDADHARAFLERHQDKLMFGSDCNDVFGRGPGCQGANILANIRKLAPTKAIERKILFENAKRVMKLKVQEHSPSVSD
jgi:uncharacterized protein